MINNSIEKQNSITKSSMKDYKEMELYLSPKVSINQSE